MPVAESFSTEGVALAQSSSDALQTAKMVLNQHKLFAAADLERYRSGEPCPIPDESGLFSSLYREEKLTASQIASRHAGLLVGENKTCKGTNEVAAWVASTLSRTMAVGLPNTFSKDEEMLLMSEYESLVRRLNNLHSYRLICRHVNIVIDSYQNIPLGDWNPAMYRCVIPVLAELKKYGRVLIPCDYFLYNEKKSLDSDNSKIPVKNSTHATSIIIEKSRADDKFLVHHFETNGEKRHGLKSESARIARMTQYHEIDRSRKFPLHRFQEYEFLGSGIRQIQNEANSAKYFLRKTWVINLSSLTEKFTQDSVVDDIEKIKKIMFPLTGKDPMNFKDSLDFIEHNLSQISGQEAIFEPQRLYARQKTSSCELKATTVPAGYLLNNEMLYQFMILSLIKTTLADAIAPDAYKIDDGVRTALMPAKADLEDRFALAQTFYRR